MSSEIDGGMAFPFFDEKVMNSPEWGMSLRDYFAANAMQALVAKLGDGHSIGPAEPNNNMQYANAAFAMADAMIAARSAR